MIGIFEREARILRGGRGDDWGHDDLVLLFLPHETLTHVERLFKRGWARLSSQSLSPGVNCYQSVKLLFQITMIIGPEVFKKWANNLEILGCSSTALTSVSERLSKGSFLFSSFFFFHSFFLPRRRRRRSLWGDIFNWSSCSSGR